MSVATEAPYWPVLIQKGRPYNPKAMVQTVAGLPENEIDLWFEKHAEAMSARHKTSLEHGRNTLSTYLFTFGLIYGHGDFIREHFGKYF